MSSEPTVSIQGAGLNLDKTRIKYEPWARLPGTKALGGGKVQLGNAVATAPVHCASGCCNVNITLICISVKKRQGITSLYGFLWLLLHLMSFPTLYLKSLSWFHGES